MKTILLLLITSLLAVGCGKQSRIDRHLARAEKAFDAGEFDRARIDYLNVLQLQNDHAEAIARLGVIFFDMGSPRQAAPFLLRTASIQPDNFEARSRLALLYAMSGELDNARKEANAILDRQPEHVDATLLLTDLARTPEDIAAARTRFAQLRQVSGPRPALHLAEAQLLLREGQLESGEAEVQKALAMDQTFAAAHLAQAALHLARTNLAGAELAFKTAADLSPIRSERRMRYLDFKRNSGAIDDARQLAQDIVKSAPDFLPALLFLARLDFDQQRPDDAWKQTDGILARDPTHYEANILRARIRLLKNEAPTAIAELERLREIYPRNPELHYQLALASLINKDLNQAIASLNESISLNPNATEAVLLLAQLNVARGDFDSAIQSLAEVVRAQPRNGRALLALGQAYRSRGRLPDALRAYQQYTAVFTNDIQGPFNTGLVLRQLNRPDEARAQFNRVLELDPKAQPAVAQLVELDLAANQPAAALARAQQLVLDNPESAGAHLVLARVLMAADRLTDAELELKKTLELDPNARPAQLLLTRLYIGSNRTMEALTELENVASRNTNDTSALLLIGTLHSESGDFDQARHAYERALAINADFPPALNNLAYLYIEKLNQPDRAYELARRARNLQPADPAIADTLGWVHYHRGEYREALNLFLESAARLPAEPEVQLHLGLTHYMLGNEEAARVALEAALNAPPDASWRGLAEQRLALLNLDTADPTVVAQLENTIKSNPADLMALLRLASINESQGKIDRAIQLSLQAIQASPNALAPNLKLAELYAARPDDRSKALAQARKARDLAPTDPAATLALGRIAFKSGDYAWALSLVEQSASRITNQPALFYDLAWARYSVGRVDDAMQSMKKAQALGLDPRLIDPANRFIELASAQRDPAEAGKLYTRAQQILQTDPTFAPALMITAIGDQQNNRILPARNAAEQALAQYPGFNPAHRLLATLYLADPPDNDKAFTHGTKAREAYPADPVVAKALGIASYRRQDSRRAIEMLAEAARTYPNDPELLYHLGLAQQAAGRSDVAKLTLEKALQLDPQSKLADAARRVLSETQ